MFDNKITRILVLFLIVFAQVYAMIFERVLEPKVFYDATTKKINTLLDDADDLQPQLDNEARDKIGQIKSSWIFRKPGKITFYSTNMKPTTPIIVELKRKRKRWLSKLRRDFQKKQVTLSALSTVPDTKWDFAHQHEWVKTYKDCGGQSQSPVNLPVKSLIHANEARQLVFQNYDVMPDNMTFVNTGQTVSIYGVWKKCTWPLISGGAANSRRYLFHSITFYWPSAHTIEGLNYPMESQLLHVSAEYDSLEEAIKNAPYDPLAILGVVNIYKFSSQTHDGINYFLNDIGDKRVGEKYIKPIPLSLLSPPFKEYVCYHGSLPVPPCTQAVLWMVRRHSLPVSRGCYSSVQNVERSPYIPRLPYLRMPQPLNDRKIFLFKQHYTCGCTN